MKLKPRFTGHDTFPLRYGWLFKAVKLIKSKELITISGGQDASRTIERLGVGKNMVNAIRYWAEASKVIERTPEQHVTELGDYLLDPTGGRDPYLEDLGTIWLLHFLLCFDQAHLTAYRYFFNYSNNIYFEKTKFNDDLTEDLFKLTEQKLVNKSTLRKDVDCFLATYVYKSRSGGKQKAIDEDHFTSPLSELGLIQDLGRGFYQCEYGERPSLPLEIFIYALVRYHRFANNDSQSDLISFEDLVSRPLSPGRIFRLSEAELGRFLDEAVAFSDGKVGWIDSLGLKQVAIESCLLEEPNRLLDSYYRVVQ